MKLLAVLASIFLVSSSQTAWPQTREIDREVIPQIRDSGPDGKSLVVLRLKKYPNCSRCPWYEIRVFQDGATMLWGKDAVAFIGVDGTYAMPFPRVRPDTPERLKKLLEKTQSEFDATRTNAASSSTRLASLLKEGQRRQLQVVEVEMMSGSNLDARIFLDGDLPNMSRISSAIEDLYFDEYRRSSTAFRPPVFESSNTLAYWRTYAHTRDVCIHSQEIDELNVTFLKDGRFRADAKRALWKSARQNQVALEREGQIDRALVDSFLRELQSFGSSLKAYQWTPMSKDLSPVLRENFRWAMHAQRQRILFVRRDDGSWADLTVAGWDESARRVEAWPEKLQATARRVSSAVWSHFPPPDPHVVAECKRRAPAK